MKTKILQFIMIFCAVSFTTAQNLIPNGDFSVWTEGSEKPDGYSYVSTDTSPQNYFSKSVEKYDETLNVLQLTYVNSSTGSTRSIITPSTTTELEPGNYKLTFYVKGSGYFRTINLAHSNVKVAAKFKTSDVAVAGDSVIIARPMGTSTAAQLFNVWTKYEVLYVVTVKGAYQICFSNNNKSGDVNNPFLFANVALESMTLSGDATVKDLTLSESAYTSRATGGVETVPGFKSDVLNYTVELSFNYAGGIPTVTATKNFAGASTVTVQATNLNGTLSERTASVEVTAQTGEKQTYTVTFVKSLDFINGFHFDGSALENKGGWGYISDSGMFTRTLNPDGKYWGTGTMRATSGGVFDFYSPELVNGCGTLKYSVKDPGYGDAQLTDLQVQYRETNTDVWTTLETISSSSLNDSWLEKTITIDNSATTGQIRFFVDRTGEGLSTLRNFLIDDVRITTYPTTGISDNVMNPEDVRINIQQDNIILQSKGKNSYQVISSSGQIIQSGVFDQYKSLNTCEKGLVIVKVGNYVKKVLVL